MPDKVKSKQTLCRCKNCRVASCRRKFQSNMVKQCAYGTCPSNTRKNPDLVFIAIPKPKTNFVRTKRWIHLCGRSNFGVANINKHSYLCENHFEKGVDLDPQSNLDLEPFPAHSEEAHRQRSFKKRKPLTTLTDNVPGLLFGKEPSVIPNFASASKHDYARIIGTKKVTMVDKSTGTDDDHLTIDIPSKFILTHCCLGTMCFTFSVVLFTEPDDNNLDNLVNLVRTDIVPAILMRDQELFLDSNEPWPKDHVSQADNSNFSLSNCYEVRMPSKPQASTSTSKTNISPERNTASRPAFKVKIVYQDRKTPKRDKDSVEKFVDKTPETCLFYTGLTRDQCEVLWNFLGDDRNDLLIFKSFRTSASLRTISIRSQFFLTLLILRRNRLFKDVAFQFNLGPHLVGKVFKTWLQFMYLKFKSLKDIMFIKKRDIPKPLPKHFQNPLCRDTRVVIDCTEIFLQSSSHFEEKGDQFSGYKVHATVKVLIGVAPSGACSFISDCYPGSISDREIVKKSGFLDYIDKNDLILADRGFTIEDLLDPLGARLNIPPFLRGKKCFSLNETQTGKVIARARIHIERFNQRFKRYAFVGSRVFQTNVPFLTQAVYVCCCLANFTSPLAQ
jgi:hypothetical protein